MLSHTPPPIRDLGRRAVAQRRLRRAATHRLFCSTNGCATLMHPDEAGQHATCPICGLRRPLDGGSRPAGPDRANGPRATRTTGQGA